MLNVSKLLATLCLPRTALLLRDNYITTQGISPVKNQHKGTSFNTVIELRIRILLCLSHDHTSVMSVDSLSLGLAI